MMSAPTKPTPLHANKTRKARLRRLEILRMRSPGLSPEASQPDDTSEGGRLERSGDVREEGPSSSSGSRSGGGDGLLYGHVSVMGRRRVMEDAVTVAPQGWLEGLEYSFFAVYDGHGGAGVAEKCRDKMHKCLEKIVKKTKLAAPPPEEEKRFLWEGALAECFSTMDRELVEDENKDRINEDEVEQGTGERMTGSTAVVVIIGKDELIVANCGDSRAVLCRGGAAVPLSSDHKPQPDRADEKERIEAAGGKVVNWNGWRVQGVLATSRSLGDRCLKPFVMAEPEVSVVKRSATDEFLIIATDGLFDVVDNELACEFVKKYLRGQIDSHATEAAAAALAELAIAKGSRDNISVIVVQLK